MVGQYNNTWNSLTSALLYICLSLALLSFYNFILSSKPGQVTVEQHTSQ